MFGCDYCGEVKGIWNVVQGKIGKYLFLPHVFCIVHEYSSLFWHDVIFYKQIAWKVNSLFWWCQCFLLVDAHLGISASKQTCSFDFIKFHLIWVMMFDGLLLCTERPWFITYFSLWVSCLYDSLLYFIQNTDALSRHLTILKSIVGWVRGWDLAGFVPGPGAALLAS